MVVLCVVWIVGVARGGDVRYVDDDAPPGGDGRTWATAHRYLQDAMAPPQDGWPSEIRIAQGKYRPDLDETGQVVLLNREESFKLFAGVAVRGGYRGAFDGSGENPDDRDIVGFRSTLTGDLLGNDEPRFVNYQDNSHHVLLAIEVSQLTIIDGFMITGGNADGDYPLHAYGGGLHSDNSELLVSRCTFTANTAPTHAGGGMYSLESSITVVDCTFSNNSGGPGAGAGMRNDVSDGVVLGCLFSGNTAFVNAGGGGFVNFHSNVDVIDCAFIDNHTQGHGGAMRNTSDSSPLVFKCLFAGNSSEATGGAMVANGTGADPFVLECTFIGNTAGSLGGAMSSNHTANPTVSRCDFQGNTAGEGGGAVNVHGQALIELSTFIDNEAVFEGGAIRATEVTIDGCLIARNRALDGSGGGILCDGPNVAIRNCTIYGNEAALGGGIDSTALGALVDNCIIWGNSGGSIEGNGPIVSYSNVQGGYSGIGNINVDPMLVDPDNDDFRLASGSPCIDAGANAAVPVNLVLDLDDHPRFVDDPDTGDTGSGRAPIVDMGAYEFQAGMCIGDITSDRVINSTDLAILLGNWGPVPPNDPIADLTGDGVVDSADLAIVLANWGPCM